MYSRGGNSVKSKHFGDLGHRFKVYCINVIVTIHTMLKRRQFFYGFHNGPKKSSNVRFADSDNNAGSGTGAGVDAIYFQVPL